MAIVVFLQLPHSRMAWLVTVSVAQAAAASDHLQSRMDHSSKEAMFESLMEVSYFPKFLFYPAAFDQLPESFQLFRGYIIRLECFECGLCRKHSRFECEMNAFQTHRIEEAGGVSNDHSAVEVVLRQRPITAFGNGFRAVREELSSFQNASYIRMRFELLESLMGVEPWIQIIKTDHEPDRHASLCHVVDKTAAKLFIAQRPAHRMNHTAAVILLLRHIPHFLYTNGKDLGVPFFIQIEFPDELFGQRTARTFSQDRNFRANINPRLEISFWMTKLIDTFVSGTHADDRVSINEKLGSRESCKDVNTAFFDLLAKPSGEFVQRDDVISVILKRRRDNRQIEFAIPGKKKNVVLLHRAFNWPTFLFPVRHEFVNAVRIHDRSGDNVRSNLLAFFENGDGKVFI